MTCSFNVQWVEDEIAATKAVLRELADATAGLTAPKADETYDRPEDDGVYGYHYTDKDPYDLKALNLYELQHTIYFFHKMVDAKDSALAAKGREWLVKTFDECDRRGMKGIRPPAIR